MKDMLKPKDPSLLTIVDCLRLLEKVYGYDVSVVMIRASSPPSKANMTGFKQREKYKH